MDLKKEEAMIRKGKRDEKNKKQKQNPFDRLDEALSSVRWGFLAFWRSVDTAEKNEQVPSILLYSIFIGPESYHCLPLSVTNWLTD